MSVKDRLALDSAQAGDLKGHVYLTSAGLLILEKITDAVITQSLSWGQLTVLVMILLVLAAVSYLDMGSAKYRARPQDDNSMAGTAMEPVFASELPAGRKPEPRSLGDVMREGRQ